MLLPNGPLCSGVLLHSECDLNTNIANEVKEKSPGVVLQLGQGDEWETQSFWLVDHTFYRSSVVIFSLTEQQKSFREAGGFKLGGPGRRAV